MPPARTVSPASCRFYSPAVHSPAFSVHKRKHRNFERHSKNLSTSISQKHFSELQRRPLQKSERRAPARHERCVLRINFKSRSSCYFQKGLFAEISFRDDYWCVEHREQPGNCVSSPERTSGIARVKFPQSERNLRHQPGSAGVSPTRVPKGLPKIAPRFNGLVDSPNA